MNLCEFPFALLADRAPKGLNTIIFSDRVEGRDRIPVERVWTVTGSDKFGLPIAGDEQVYVALMEVTREQGFKDRQIFVTRYDLIKRLGWADKGQSYRRLRDGLDRLLGVTIKAERAFWDKTVQKYVSVGFHIIDDYALYDEAPGRKGAKTQVSMPLSYITWNSVIFQSFEAGNIKQLDAAFYFSLRSAISRRLFRYLDKKRYDGKASFRIGLQKLAFEKLGMSRNYFPSHIRQELRRAHDELCTTGYLRDVEFFKPGGSAAEQVVYHFAKRKADGLLPRPAAQDTPPASGKGNNSAVADETPAHRDTVQALVQAGVTEKVAEALVRDYGAEAQAQLQYLPYRHAHDPAAVLVEAIRNHWEPPASYLREQADNRRRERLEAEAETARAEQAVREERRARQQAMWEALPAEKRTAIEAEAAQALAQSNPFLASRTDSATYKTLLRAECLRRVLTGEEEELAP